MSSPCTPTKQSRPVLRNQALMVTPILRTPERPARISKDIEWYFLDFRVLPNPSISILSNSKSFASIKHTPRIKRSICRSQRMSKNKKLLSRSVIKTRINKKVVSSRTSVVKQRFPLRTPRTPLRTPRRSLSQSARRFATDRKVKTALKFDRNGRTGCGLNSSAKSVKSTKRLTDPLNFRLRTASKSEARAKNRRERELRR